MSNDIDISEMTSGWAVIEERGGLFRHVVPINDLHDHLVDGEFECWCHPKIEDGGVIVHNSADKRELYERGEQKVA